MQNTEVCAALERATDVMLESWATRQWEALKKSTTGGVPHFLYIDRGWIELERDTLYDADLNAILMLFNSYIRKKGGERPKIYLIQNANFKRVKNEVTINKYTNSFVESRESINEVLQSKPGALDIKKPHCMLFFKPGTTVTIKNVSSEYTADMAKKFPSAP